MYAYGYEKVFHSLHAGCPQCLFISLIESDVLLFLLPPVLSCTYLSPLLETTSYLPPLGLFLFVSPSSFSFLCPSAPLPSSTRLRSVKMEQRKLNDQANTLVDLAKVSFQVWLWRLSCYVLAFHSRLWWQDVTGGSLVWWETDGNKSYTYM